MSLTLTPPTPYPITFPTLPSKPHTPTLLRTPFHPLCSKAPPLPVEEAKKVSWGELDPAVEELHGHALAHLSPKLTRRCRAVVRRIVCLESLGERLDVVLGSWERTMKPRRADWLAIIRELKTIQCPLLLEVMEHALTEDTFEANIRDYTKMIDAYAKQNRVLDAENVFSAMKERGFTCDQITLTVLVHMYSKAGDLDQAKETFEEIKLLGLPLDRRSYDSMIMAYIRAGMPENGESLLLEMDREEIYASREVYKALLRAYSSAGNIDGAQRVFEAIQFAGIAPDEKLCALLVNAYCMGGLLDKARGVFENMKHTGLKPSDKCVAVMLAAYEGENKLEMAVSLLVELERDGVAIGREAREILVKWFQKLGLVDELGPILQEIKQDKS